MATSHISASICHIKTPLILSTYHHSRLALLIESPHCHLQLTFASLTTLSFYLLYHIPSSDLLCQVYTFILFTIFLRHLLHCKHWRSVPYLIKSIMMKVFKFEVVALNQHYRIFCFILCRIELFLPKMIHHNLLSYCQCDHP